MEMGLAQQVQAQPQGRDAQQLDAQSRTAITIRA
jgi:hypothetical protein